MLGGDEPEQALLQFFILSSQKPYNREIAEGGPYRSWPLCSVSYSQGQEGREKENDTLAGVIRICGMNDLSIPLSPLPSLWACFHFLKTFGSSVIQSGYVILGGGQLLQNIAEGFVFCPPF